jgi:hypothetical protein
MKGISMARSIKARLVIVFVVAIASFGIFAGAALASSYSGVESIHSWNSHNGGTYTVACFGTGGTHSNAAPSAYWGWPAPCGQG